jgi:hypothetical protein
MLHRLSRRDLIKAAAVFVPASQMNLMAGALDSKTSSEEGNRMPISDAFPGHPHELVREMVTVAHFDLKRVKELVSARPSLARAAWDWGFGDWESALGAASHMGNRAIAEYLIAQGARPSLFSAAMLGQFDVVKAFVASQPGVQRIRGPHSISLLAHARMGGEAARPVFELLESLGGADADPPVSLSEPEAAALVGSYVFGVGISQQVEVSADMKMYASSKMYAHPPQLNWTRKGTMTRPLFHLGGREFYPAGAAFARIRFTEDEGAMLMTVTDAELVVTARRKNEG